jgi:hypothetical protein
MDRCQEGLRTFHASPLGGGRRDEPLASVTTVFGRLRKERDLDGKTRNGILCTLSRHGEHAKPGEAKLPFLRFSVRYVDRVHACHVSSGWIVRSQTYAMRCWRRALMVGTCLKITPPAPRIIGLGWLRLWRSKERLFFGEHL